MFLNIDHGGNLLLQEDLSSILVRMLIASKNPFKVTERLQICYKPKCLCVQNQTIFQKIQSLKNPITEN